MRWGDLTAMAIYYSMSELLKHLGHCPVQASVKGRWRFGEGGGGGRGVGVESQKCWLASRRSSSLAQSVAEGGKPQMLMNGKRPQGLSGQVQKAHGGPKTIFQQ